VRRASKIRASALVALALVTALVGGLATMIALGAPVTATKDFEPGRLVVWLVFLVGLAGGAYLVLGRFGWRARGLVFGLATLSFAVLFFAATDWHVRDDSPAEACFRQAPSSLLRSPEPNGPLGLVTANGAHIGPPFFDRADVQRMPPGVRCVNRFGSFLARPSEQDWLVLLGESAAAGFAVTGPILWLLRRRRRRTGLSAAPRTA
jgi:hypothetical protein